MSNYSLCGESKKIFRHFLFIITFLVHSIILSFQGVFSRFHVVTQIKNSSIQRQPIAISHFRCVGNKRHAMFHATTGASVQPNMKATKAFPSSSPVNHARGASLSMGETGGGVCGRFRIHGGRLEGVGPACRGQCSFTGTTG